MVIMTGEKILNGFFCRADSPYLPGRMPSAVLRREKISLSVPQSLQGCEDLECRRVF
jgi:hypothetical protein